MSKKIIVPDNAKELPLAIVKQMLSLATSGFGLVAALAWNDLVKETTNSYLKPILPEGSRVLTLLFYAVIVTALAVLVTLQLAKIQSTLEKRLQNNSKNK